MLGNDILEECESAWASPVVMVPKSDGSIRVGVDYRKLNSVTTPDRIPLPRMDDLLQAAKRSNYMTTLDLQRGYYQVEVALEDRDKTTATFHRLINRFKCGIPDVCILAYLDDIIICSESFEKHMEDLNIVLERLIKYQLRLNKAKCRFCCSEVKFLGHVLTSAGIAVDNEKIRAIVSRREPGT